MGKIRKVAEVTQSKSQSGGMGSKGGKAVTARVREKDPWQC